VILILALFGVMVNLIAWKNGFYYLEPEKRDGFKATRFKHVISIFAIYLSTSFFVPRLLASFPTFRNMPPFHSLAWIQAVSTILTLTLLYLYCKTLFLPDLRTLWKRPLEKVTPSLAQDFITGIGCWFLTFPLITILGHYLDRLVNSLFGLEHYEQVAIRFLKAAKEFPPLLVIAIIMVIIVAPIVEEFLFRGVLQTYLKGHLGRKAAIGVSSLAFGLFHFSFSHKLGNLSLVTTLFVFACFLGFLYEKRKSLLAPIGLHMAFNLISSLRVLFLLEGI
jgi:hypothetical protein